MPAAPADIRKWAKGQGRDVTARGPLPAELVTEYEAEHQGPEPGPEDFPPLPDITEPGPPPPDLTEKAPRPVVTPRGRGLAGVLDKTSRGPQPGKDKPGRSRKAHPRVPVDKLISTGWGLLASFARPIPPTSRLLRLQAPVAGVLLEDVVRGSVVDRVLQPLARGEESGKAMAALLGPPLLVTMISLQPSALPVLLPMLRHALLIWCEVAGPKMKLAVAREADFEDTYGETVDDMIELILAAAPTNPAEKAEDDERITAFVNKAARG